MATAPPVLAECTIVSRENTPPGFWCLRFRQRAIAAAARPAQYVALDIPGPFSLRVPLGIWTAEDDEFSVLFREWGERTSRLARLPAGTALSCIGPLGNEFTLPAQGGRAVIVAGGLGVAPFWLLGRELRRREIETTVVLGARSADLLVGRGELEALGFDVRICTDDGTAGLKGSVIDYIAQLSSIDMLYGCGPRGMLRALCEHANARAVPCQVSVEENFACSMGTCWGCVVPVRRGCSQATGYPRAARERREFDFARACTDGTVFAATDILWLS